MLIKDIAPDAVRTPPSRLAMVALVLIVTTLLVSGCQEVGDNRTVKWRVDEADHPVSVAAALERAKPVIIAVTDAIDDFAGPGEWGEPTVRTDERDARCGQIVSKSGSFPFTPTPDNSDLLRDTVATAAAPLGYTDVVTQGRGGPGTEFADVAANDTMLVVGHNAGEDATIEVYVPAHHDQCND